MVTLSHKFLKSQIPKPCKLNSGFLLLKKHDNKGELFMRYSNSKEGEWKLIFSSIYPRWLLFFSQFILLKWIEVLRCTSQGALVIWKSPCLSCLFLRVIQLFIPRFNHGQMNIQCIPLFWWEKLNTANSCIHKNVAYLIQELSGIKSL